MILYSILINDVILYYLALHTYNLVQLLTILISYCATIAQYVLSLGLFRPLLIVLSTCTKNTLNVYTLGPYDLKY